MFAIPLPGFSQSPNAASPSEAWIHFDQKIREWDGFGANYVEVRHTRDYDQWPQDYAGFSYLSDAQKEEIIDLVFGDEGLRVSLLKMFLDPYHEPTPDNDDPHTIDLAGFEHERTTENMRYFAREGLARTRNRGDDLTVLAGLYAGPSWAITQGDWGRDLIPHEKYELGEYMVSWVKYLREVENLPVKYLSLHNEEAHDINWDEAGFPTEDLMRSRLDRGLAWPTEQIVDFLTFMPEMLEAQGLGDVGITPGETVFWSRLIERGISQQIINDRKALENLSLITSHGFISLNNWGQFNTENYRPEGINILRAKRPDLHAWTTSCKLDGYLRDEADMGFMEQFWLQIYVTGVNGIIPWATVHCQWESDRRQDGSFQQSGNRNSPIHVIRTSENSGYYEVRKGYYFYKQLTRAGQSGMAVAATTTHDPKVRIIAFSKDDTDHPDSFVIFNSGEKPQAVSLHLSGTSSSTFTGYITSEAGIHDVNYDPVDDLTLSEGKAALTIPAKSSIVFFGQP